MGTSISAKSDGNIADGISVSLGICWADLAVSGTSLMSVSIFLIINPLFRKISYSLQPRGAFRARLEKH